jgi:hypothetical protein
MTNVREFAYDDWVKEVFQGCIDKGPPMALVVARTFVDMSTGQILTLDGIEQYWVPYAHAPDAEPCALIIPPDRIRLRVIHYYDPATWKPDGNWGNGRYVGWTKTTTRPFEMWPEVWGDIGPKVERLAIGEWCEEVECRAVVDRAARERQIVHDRSGIQHSASSSRASGSRVPAARALAASAFDFEAWKPWSRKVNQMCELQIPAMPL